MENEDNYQNFNENKQSSYQPPRPLYQGSSPTQPQPTAQELIETQSIQPKPPFQERIKAWLKNPSNLILAIIFISIIVLRFYFFWITQNQPVWWDESEYLSGAKSFAGLVDYQLHEIRLPGLPRFISLFYLMGINQEHLIRFFVLFIPSVLMLLIFYFLIREMYPDKRIALISTIIFGVLWESLFYSNRFQPENLSILFEFFAFLILFKVYIKKEKLGFITPVLSLIWILLFSALAIVTRSGNAPFFPTIILFVIILNQSFFLSKNNRKFSLTFLIVSIVAVIFASLNIEKIPVIRVAYHPEFPIGWSSLTIFSGYFNSITPNIPSVFLYAFYIGLILVIINTFSIIDRIKIIHRDNKNLDFKSDLFNLILLSSVLFVFVFIIKPPGIEFRWLFMILPPILVFTSKGIISFAEFTGDFLKNKKAVLIIIILILSVGVYDQVHHGDSIIKTKLNTYSQLRDAGLWIKQNSKQEDIVLSRSPHQITYYSERKTYNYGDFSESQFFELVKETNPKYMLESSLEPHTGQWGYEPTPAMQKIMTPVQVWYAEDNQTPIAVLYAFNQNSVIEQNTNQASIEEIFQDTE